MSYVVMTYIVMAYIVIAYIVMAYIVMTYIVMAYIVMAYIFIAYTVMSRDRDLEAWGHERERRLVAPREVEQPDEPATRRQLGRGLGQRFILHGHGLP